MGRSDNFMNAFDASSQPPSPPDISRVLAEPAAAAVIDSILNEISDAVSMQRTLKRAPLKKNRRNLSPWRSRAWYCGRTVVVVVAL